MSKVSDKASDLSLLHLVKEMGGFSSHCFYPKRVRICTAVKFC